MYLRIDMNNDILTIKEVAEYLKLTEKTSYRLAAEGKIPGFKVGGSWRFKRSEIEAWIDAQSNMGRERRNG
jgi:excisionase family DNA binding protein